LKTYCEKTGTAKGVVLFTSKTNTLSDRIQTGIDCVRFQSAISQRGFVIHPMSQVLQEFPEMANLQKRVTALVNTKDRAKVQMAVRIGKGKNCTTLIVGMYVIF